MSKFKANDPRSAQYRRAMFGEMYPDRDIDLTDAELEALPQEKVDELSLHAPPMKDYPPEEKAPEVTSTKSKFDPKNIDYEHAMDVKGRIGATNLGDESDPGTIAKLQSENPDTTFVKFQGHVFAKGPNDQSWRPYKSDAFTWYDPSTWVKGNPASDHIADVAKPVGAIAATMGLKLPLTGIPGMLAQGSLAGGLEAAREGLGVATGYRSKMDPKQIGLNAAGGALLPVIGAGMGAPIIRKAGQLIGSDALENAAGAPGSIAGLIGRVVSKVGGLSSGYSSDLMDKFLDPKYAAAIKKWTGLNGDAALKQAVDEATQPVLNTAAKNKTYLGSLIRTLNDASPGKISTQWVRGADGKIIQGPALALRAAIGEQSANLGPGSSQAMRDATNEVTDALTKHLPSNPATGQVWNQEATPSQLFDIEQGLRTEVRPKTSMGQIVSEPSREVKSAATAMQKATKALRQQSVLDQQPKYTQEMLDQMDQKYGVANDQNDMVRDAFTSQGSGPDLPHAINGMDRLATGSDPALRGTVNSILGPEGNPALEAELGNDPKRMSTDTFNDKVGDLRNAGVYYGDQAGIRPSISPKLMAIRGILNPRRVMQLNELLGSMGQPIDNPGIMSSGYRQVLPNYLNYKYEEQKP